MLKELQDMGLLEKEARVYLASLELGQATAEKLATHAKVNRSTTYVQLESLMEKGLMSTHEEGKKTYFAPESPELLKRLLLKQKDAVSARERDLAAILPALLLQFQGAGERPVVRFFPGKAGITAVREEVLTTKDKELYVLFSSDNMSKIYSDAELDDYSSKRTAANIRSKAIYTHKKYFDAMVGQTPLTHYTFVPDLPLSIDIRIFDNKTAIFSLDGTPFALVIESLPMAASMKTIFEFIWKHGGEK